MDCSVNLRRLTIQSSQISETNIKNKLCEKKLITHIKIIFMTDVNLDDIYDVMQIKSINTLCLREYYNLHDNYFLNYEKIFKILCYVVNTLNKNIKIVFNCESQDIIFKKFISLITYNFKINNHDHIFTYIPTIFRKFDNLHDFNLCYQ